MAREEGEAAAAGGLVAHRLMAMRKVRPSQLIEGAHGDLQAQRRAAVALRQATLDDVPLLERLIAASARGLSQGDYTVQQIDAALGSAWGVDSELIGDGTYFVAEVTGEVIGCGGWSRRRTLFGGDAQGGRESALLDPMRDSARIRAFFVRPDWARCGVGQALLDRCEAAARAAGFRSVELVATLPGQRLYRAHGYTGEQQVDYPLPGGLAIRFVPMRKVFGAPGPMTDCGDSAAPGVR